MLVRGADMLRQITATKEWERRMVKELERDFKYELREKEDKNV